MENYYKINLLDESVGLIKPGRMVGNTTRLVDKAVQLLFDGVELTVQDHYKDGTNKTANTELLNKIIKRLLNEFPVDIVVDREKMIIKLKGYGKQFELE